jgi:hypothetical protein
MKLFCILLLLIFNYTSFLTCLENHIKPKLCFECKHFKKDFFITNKFGKCILFPRIENDYFFVDGIKNTKKDDYFYCSTARRVDNMCGKEGVFYEKK